MEERDQSTDVAPAGTELPRLSPGDFQFTRERRTDDPRDEGLHICPACDSGLVHPVDWSPAAGRGWTGGGNYSQKVVDRFDEVLDDGTEALLDDLNRLARANMEEHVEAFAAALEADRILPEDF
jgi:hypothetical protein